MRHVAHLLAAIPIVLASCCPADSPPVSQSRSIAPAKTTPSTGSLVGTVRFSGVIKSEVWRNPLPANVDASKLRTLIVGELGELANVYVAVKSGLGDRKFKAPTEAVILNQVGQVSWPHVLALMTGQPLVVRNNDNVMHNIHGLSRLNREFNEGQEVKGSEDTLTFTVPELGIPVKCDVHPWMQAWIHVSDHPFFAATWIDGKYSIRELPPGEYEILAWHERFFGAMQVAKTKVVAGGTATLDFTFTVPRR